MLAPVASLDAVGSEADLAATAGCRAHLGSGHGMRIWLIFARGWSDFHQIVLLP